MNRFTILLLLGAPAAGQIASALDAAAWRHHQPFSVIAPGITRIELPAETLNASRQQLEDIRLLAPSGAEFPFVIERASLTPPRSAAPREFKSSITDGGTVIEIETGSADAIEAVALDTPAPDFIKAARVEASADGAQWNEIARNEVIFRQANGAGRLRIPFASASHGRLRITIDDRRTPPVPFTAARIEFTDQRPLTVPQGAAIARREEKPDETVLSIDLGAANLNLALLRLSVTDPVFSRRVTVSYDHDDNGAIRSVTVASAVIYRVTTNDGLSAESLDVPVHRILPVAKATLTIANGDSPPLNVRGIEAARQPVSLVFFAQDTGEWRLMTGNGTVGAPSYDLGTLDRELRQGSAAKVQVGALAENPAYKEQPALPDVEPEGANIDLGEWRFRKPVATNQTGVLRVELDAETLARAQPSLADLRVIQSDRQIPFLVDRTNADREVEAALAKDSDPKRRTVSLWRMKMPLDGLPSTKLTCTSTTPLFDRTLTVWAKRKDHMGNEFRTQLGAARWTMRSENKGNAFSIPLGSARVPEVFFIETDNGDNPPIEIANVNLHYSASAVVAKVTGSAPVHLYYGNAEAYAPRYDLQLVRAELLAARKQNATLGKEEVLRPAKKSSGEVSAGSPWLWAALGVVIVALLWVVSKMLPTAPKTD